MKCELIHGDCIEKMKDIPDGSIDLVLTDPPYGTTACKWDTVIPFEPMWAQLKRVTKKNGAIVLFGSQPFTSALVMSNPKMFKYSLVWSKSQTTGFLNANRMPLREHEDIILFYSKQPTYNPLKTKGKRQLKSTGGHTENYGKFTYKPHYSEEYFPKSIIRIAQQRVKNGHPTQKPVALMEYLIKTYTNEGETVLDFTMGSGTTGVACKNLNRNFIGIELDEQYFNIARERINGAQPSML